MIRIPNRNMRISVKIISQSISYKNNKLEIGKEGILMENLLINYFGNRELKKICLLLWLDLFS